MSVGRSRFTSEDPWRFELPCGHGTSSIYRCVSISRGNPGAYTCRNCGGKFPYKLDKKTGDPVK